MKATRQIIVYIATSADGHIARPDGDVDATFSLCALAEVTVGA